MLFLTEIKFEDSNVVAGFLFLLFRLIVVLIFIVAMIFTVLNNGRYRIQCLLSCLLDNFLFVLLWLLGLISLLLLLGLILLRSLEAISQADYGFKEVELIFVLLVKEHVHRVLKRLVFFLVHVQAPTFRWIFELALIDHDAIRFAPHLKQVLNFVGRSLVTRNLSVNIIRFYS